MGAHSKEFLEQQERNLKALDDCLGYREASIIRQALYNYNSGNINDLTNKWDEVVKRKTDRKTPSHKLGSESAFKDIYGNLQ